ncbi:hypothetical protein Tco_0473930 [Tanacetum coccineum]
MTPMALSDSEVTTCSKSCLKNYETLKKQHDDLRIELNQSEFNLANYKRGLASVQERLVFYKKNEGVGYNAVAPPPTGLFAPPTIDLSSSGLEEFQQPEFEGYGLRANKSVCENSSNETKKNSDAPLIEEWVSDNEDEVESPVVVEKKTVVPTIPKVDVVRPKQQEKPVRKTVRYAEMYRSKGPRGNQRNWNNLKSQQLGSNFVMYNKACYVCGSFDHLQYTCKQKRQLNGQREEKPVWNNARRVNHQNSPRITHPNPKRHMVPRKILTRSGPISLNTARQSHFNVVRTNRVNAVKASACWVWRPIKPNSASITLKRYDYVDGNPEIELEDSVRLNSPEDKKVTYSLYKLKNQSRIGINKLVLTNFFVNLGYGVTHAGWLRLLKRDASFNESKINALKIQIQKLKKEKESNQFRIENFENASKSLDKLIERQISDNNKKVGKNSDAPLIEEWDSDNEDEVEFSHVVVEEKKNVVPTILK